MTSSLRKLALFLVGGMLAGIGFTGTTAIADSFSDTGSHAFVDEIDWLTDYDIASGFNDGTFRPNGTITRGQAAFWMRNLSAQTVVVNESDNPAPFTQFSVSATCPGDRRAVAGGGLLEGANALMINSYPSGEATWSVQWRSDDGATVDPDLIRAFVTCVPRL